MDFPLILSIHLAIGIVLGQFGVQYSRYEYKHNRPGAIDVDSFDNARLVSALVMIEFVWPVLLLTALLMAVLKKTDL